MREGGQPQNEVGNLKNEARHYLSSVYEIYRRGGPGEGREGREREGILVDEGEPEKARRM